MRQSSVSRKPLPLLMWSFEQGSENSLRQKTPQSLHRKSFSLLCASKPTQTSESTDNSPIRTKQDPTVLKKGLKLLAQLYGPVPEEKPEPVLSVEEAKPSEFVCEKSVRRASFDTFQGKKDDKTTLSDLKDFEEANRRAKHRIAKFVLSPTYPKSTRHGVQHFSADMDFRGISSPNSAFLPDLHLKRNETGLKPLEIPKNLTLLAPPQAKITLTPNKTNSKRTFVYPPPAHCATFP